jgi:hypothetical protein
MTFEQVLDLYLAMQKAFSQLPVGNYESEATKVADKNFYDALFATDFIESEFYDYAELNGLFD